MARAKVKDDKKIKLTLSYDEAVIIAAALAEIAGSDAAYSVTAALEPLVASAGYGTAGPYLSDFLLERPKEPVFPGFDGAAFEAALAGDYTGE